MAFWYGLETFKLRGQMAEEVRSITNTSSLDLLVWCCEAPCIVACSSVTVVGA